ncbi:hypothetical protein FBU30_001299, partial [Linnemannia zychae]
VCASTFDPVCGYDDKALMDCGNAGDVPTDKETCTLSCTVQPGPDVCTFDPCACTKTGNLCSSSFPASCGLETTSIYACSSIRALPVKRASCLPSQICFETANAPTCTYPECICSDASNRCGSVFPPICGFKTNTLYKCTAGSLPISIRDCGTGTCSANIAKVSPADVSVREFHAMADDICIDQCACKAANTDVCSSEFNAICNYAPKTVMHCEAIGKAPTVKETCTASCTIQSGPAVCAFDPCACAVVGDVCGSDFPASCGFKTTTVYTCPAVKALPIKRQTCLGNAICFRQPVGPRCTLSECICKDNDKHCGSAFFGACNLASNSLYQCSTGALPVVIQDCSPGVCSGNIISDTNFVSIGPNATLSNPKYKAMVDEFCVDQCACREGETFVCGSIFDSVCNYNPSALMDCHEVGSMPEEVSICSKGCKQTPISSECNFDPCACIGPGDTCGSTLDPTCGYDPNIVYACQGLGALPEKKLDCGSNAKCTEAAPGPTGQAEFMVAGNDICIDKCACQEAFVPICAASFPVDCGYNDRTLLSCGNQGDVPIVSETLVV